MTSTDPTVTSTDGGSAPLQITPQNQTVALGSGSSNDYGDVPRLGVDHDRGEWKYLGVTIERPALVFFGMQDMRRFYAEPYDKNPKAPLTCGSWNGRDAFGFGGREAKGAPIERDCYACPREDFHANKGTKEWCAPTPLVFGMLVHNESDVWTPYFWDASGMLAKEVKAAYKRASDASQAFFKDGKQTKPVFSFCYMAALQKNPDKFKKGYLCSLTSTKLTDADLAFIGSFRIAHGLKMWDDEVARRTNKIRTLGGTVGSGSQAPISMHDAAPADIGEVPF